MLQNANVLISKNGIATKKRGDEKSPISGALWRSRGDSNARPTA